MTLFLLIYLGVYGGVNLYFFWKVHSAWPGPLWFTVALGAFCVLVVGAPILVRVFERSGYSGAARVLALVGHTWMALVFWFFLLALAGDCWNLMVRGASLLKPQTAALLLGPRPAVIAVGILVVLLAVWAFHGAADIRVKTVTVKTPKLPAGAAAVRIVDITDVHLGLTTSLARLRRIVRRIEEARPDILLSTGDLVDAELAHVRERAPLLAAVKASMGKFAVLGNHEYYAGLDESLAVNRAAGFQTLRGGSAEAGPFRLVGVDDSVGFRTRAEWLQHEAAALAGAHDGRFVLLLKHRPAFNPDSAGKFDLQLSGHSHGGQIFPFYSVVKMFNPMPLGLSALTGGSRLYHSRGTGTWGPQMRLLSPPEVTLILLEPQ